MTQLRFAVVIIIGGPQKGTRFRPLSLEMPKPLFPVAGKPILYHLVEACSQIKNGTNAGIFIIGAFDLTGVLNDSLISMEKDIQVPIKYLREEFLSGSAGGLSVFRETIMADNPDVILFLNGDVYGDLPLDEMLQFYQEQAKSKCVIMVTETSEKASLEYGCVVVEPQSQNVLHYVEKPETYVSNTVSCGTYLFDPETLYQLLNEIVSERQDKSGTSSIGNANKHCLLNGLSNHLITLETDVFPSMAASNKLMAFETKRKWGSIKLPRDVLTANRRYLDIHAGNTETTGQQYKDSFVHPFAVIDQSAVIGPNVSIGPNVHIGYGVRIREAILVANCIIGANSCIRQSILGSNVRVGEWCRIDGIVDESKKDCNESTETTFGVNHCNPAITVIGSNVKIASELMIRNSIVLPDKEINRCCNCEVVL